MDSLGGYEGLKNRLRSLKLLMASAAVAAIIGVVAGTIRGGGSWTPFVIL